MASIVKAMFLPAKGASESPRVVYREPVVPGTSGDTGNQWGHPGFLAGIQDVLWAALVSGGPDVRLHPIGQKGGRRSAPFLPRSAGSRSASEIWHFPDRPWRPTECSGFAPGNRSTW